MPWRATAYALVFTVLVVSQVNASPYRLTVGAFGDYIVGEIMPGVGGRDGRGQVTRDLLMVNTILGLASGETATIEIGRGDYTVYRSTLYGDLNLQNGAAVGANAICGSAGGSSDCQALGLDDSNRFIEITIPVSGPYHYLIAAWGGPRAGAQVWYVGDLPAGATLLIPRFVRFEGGNLVENTTNTQYGLTTWTLFDPPSAIPDGGATLALLGLSILGIGCLGTKWSKRSRSCRTTGRHGGC